MKKCVFLYVIAFLLMFSLSYATVPDADRDGVPDGNILPPGSDVTQEKINAKLEVINKYYNIANTDNKVVAIVPYLWGSYIDDGRLYKGVRDIPAMKERYRQIGREYTGR